MRVIESTAGIPPEFREAFITIGNFDGIHLGHRRIFEKMIREAHAEQRKALLVTFVPHPKMVLHPERKPFYLLTTLEEKIGLLEALGLDGLVLVPFTFEYAKMTAESFIRDFLRKELGARKIFIGHDYSFGKDKGGNAEMLAEFGKKLGFDVVVVNAVSGAGNVISSTRIREAILAGDVQTAALLLGRPYNVSGVVVKGKRRGASLLGFPTANIKPHKELLPARGVYAAFVNLAGKRYDSVLNVGFNPTFGDKNAGLSLEVHLLDFSGDIYGKSVDIQFIERIREEREFPGPEQLALQIKEDMARAREILKSHFPEHSPAY